MLSKNNISLVKGLEAGIRIFREGRRGLEGISLETF
jgi:hypothetical protein